MFCATIHSKTRVYFDWDDITASKVEYRAGELFPRLGFIVTNLEMPSRSQKGNPDE
jgi:hypothetical protein